MARNLFSATDRQTLTQQLQSTPNGAVRNGLSPAEALMGQKLHTTLDILQSEQHQQNTFPFDTRVFARNYRSGQQNWTPGTIHKRKGQYIYDVQAESQLRTRQKNQIHPRYTKKDIVSNNSLHAFKSNYSIWFTDGHFWIAISFKSHSGKSKWEWETSQTGKSAITLGWDTFKLILSVWDMTKYLNREALTKIFKGSYLPLTYLLFLNKNSFSNNI